MGDWDDETVAWYVAKYGEYATNRLGVDALAIPDGAVVVDVGCGTGAALRRIAERLPHATMIGVDPAPKMVRIARERAAAHPEGGRLEFREGSVADLPVDDSAADWVLAFDSIDHWPEAVAGLREVHRILARGGRLAVVKDGAVASARQRRAFLAALGQAGFEVEREQAVRQDEVEFTLWVVRPTCP